MKILEAKSLLAGWEEVEVLETESLRLPVNKFKDIRIVEQKTKKERVVEILKKYILENDGLCWTPEYLADKIDDIYKELGE